MKSHLLAGVSALIFSALATSAYAADAQAVEVLPAQNLWYVSLFGGASFAQDVKTIDYADDEYSLDLNTGFVVGAAVGWRINDAFRVEGEVSYARYKTDSYSYTCCGGGTDPASGDLSATYLLANAWADVARFGQATAYVGGGLGAAYVTADTTFDGSTGWGYGKGEWGFAGQLGAGVTYAIAQNIDLDFGYRFKAVTDIDFDDADGDKDYFTGGNLYTHNLQFGITAKF